MGGVGLDIGWKIFSVEKIQWIFWLYIASIFSLWLYLFYAISKVYPLKAPAKSERILGVDPWKYAFLFLGILWLPSHLIWKPYFLLGMPVILLGVQWLILKQRYEIIGLMIFLTGFTGLDLLGPIPATYLEAWCLQLFLYFIWVGLAFYAVRAKPKGHFSLH